MSVIQKVFVREFHDTFEVIADEKERGVFVDINDKTKRFVYDKETNRWFPEGYEQEKEDDKYAMMLMRVEKKANQKTQVRPFRVNYNWPDPMPEDDPMWNRIHEIISIVDEEYQFQNRDGVKLLLVHLPKKEYLLSPYDHARFTDHSGKGKTFKRMA